MTVLSILLAVGICVAPVMADDHAFVMTVNGPVSSDQLGSFLPHEHIMSSFGATEEQAAAYDRGAAFDTVFPYLTKVKSLGLTTLADCTAAYFGRDPVLLKMLSDSTGVHLITNTGYYAAAKDRYVPRSAYSETADQIADRWVREFEEGIDGTGIRPGFIKIGIDGQPLSDIDAKIVRAAAITHRRTGLTIASHTGGHPLAAEEQLQILKEESVHPSAWIWVHANKVAQASDLISAAEKGAWIELDAIRENTIEQHLAYAKYLNEGGHSDRVLLSHDGNSMRLTGNPPRQYERLFTDFIPLLRKSGLENSVDLWTVKNPARAFIVSKRLTGQ
jgi:predicted metal-dependent phosphotriesterase family hydrolase